MEEVKLADQRILHVSTNGQTTVVTSHDIAKGVYGWYFMTSISDGVTPVYSITADTYEEAFANHVNAVKDGGIEQDVEPFPKYITDLFTNWDNDMSLPFNPNDEGLLYAQVLTGSNEPFRIDLDHPCMLNRFNPTQKREYEIDLLNYIYHAMGWYTFVVAALFQANNNVNKAVAVGHKLYSSNASTGYQIFLNRLELFKKNVYERFGKEYVMQEQPILDIVEGEI